MAKYIDLSKQLDNIHKKLQTQFAVKEDVQLAKELELFFNYVVYQQDSDFDNNAFEILTKVLRKDLLDKLKTNSDLIELFTDTKKEKIGERGEEAFATLLEEILLANINDLEEIAAAEMVKKLKDPKSIIKADDLATVTIPEKMVELVEKSQQKLVSDNSHMRFALRKGKTDIDTSSLSFEGAWSEQASKLIGLTASVKNYNNFEVKLENVNRRKAYLAVIPQLKRISTSAASQLYENYFIKKTMPPDENVMLHLEHIFQIYALTGYGQSAINDAGEIVMQNYSRFLFYNNPSAKKIIVKSTKQIIQDEILTQSAFASFYSRQSSKNKNVTKIKYRFQH